MTQITRKIMVEGRPVLIGRFLVMLLLTAMLAHSGAELTWEFLAAHPSAILPAAPVAQPVRAGKKPAAAGRTGAVAVPLFGEGERPRAGGAAARPADAPQTRLKLLLKGVVAAEPMARAVAIISEKGKKGKGGEVVYGIGDSLPGGAILREIYVDRVILERAGVRETLLLEEVEGAGSGKILSGALAGRLETVMADGDGVHWRINGDYWRKRLADLPSLAREVGVEVYKENNVQKGYRLVSSRGSRLLTELGLKAGDILHEVNGIPLNNISGSLSVYEKVRNAPEIRVVIGRNGQRETKIYNITDIAGGS